MPLDIAYYPALRSRENHARNGGDMPDQGIEPIEVERGPLLTLQEASRLTNRPVRLLQRWIKDGKLASRFRQAEWPYGALVTWQDLSDAHVRHKHWGTKTARKRQELTTLSGKPFTIRSQEGTDSRLPG